MKLLLSVVLVGLLVCPLFAADKCKVNDTNINTEYSGGCVNGLANGYGIAKGKNIYEGGFVNGNKASKGSYMSASGFYAGEFKDDKFNGEGTFDL